jgi:hypothetical protein
MAPFVVFEVKSPRQEFRGLNLRAEAREFIAVSKRSVSSVRGR